MNQFDNIKKMSREQFAELLNSHSQYCNMCIYTPHDVNCIGKGCVDGIKKWLESEYLIPLKVCPFCGGENVTMRETSQSQYFVQCRTCGGSGGVTPTENKAKEKWNRRGIE